MNKLAGLTLSVFCAAVLGGCGAASNAVNTTNKTNVSTNVSNVAVVVPNNSNVAANTTVGNTSRWNPDISREEYDKSKEDYSTRAKEAGSTIGSGLNDGWIWTKTKAALSTADGLRDSTINVDVDKDVITLKGTVATAAQKTQAETVAKGIKDQKGVKNELKVQANDSMTNQMVGSDNSNSKTSNTNSAMKK